MLQSLNAVHCAALKIGGYGYAYVFDRRDGEAAGGDAGFDPCGIESKRAGRSKPRRQSANLYRGRGRAIGGVV